MRTLLRSPTSRAFLACSPPGMIIGLVISIGAAYIVTRFGSLMDYVQALFSFFIAPLFGTVLLGMLWKRMTGAGAFWGLLAGTVSSIAMFTMVELDPSKVTLFAFYPQAKPLAQDMWRALWSWIICVAVTVVVTALTKPRTDAELTGLVYGATELPSEGEFPIVKRPIFWAGLCFAVFLILQWIFW